MEMARHYLAIDLGAESGRVMAGRLVGDGGAEGGLELEELHRFANEPRMEQGHLVWNFPRLLEEIEAGLRKAAQTGRVFESISTDSWGVDYVLFDRGGRFLPPAFHYRDARTAEGVRRALARVSWETIFAETGIQFMPLNSLFQLAAEAPERLEQAGFLLGIGDAVHYHLCGVAKIEVSMASTFQLYNPIRREWSEALLERLGLPQRLFPEIVPSGTRLGVLRPEMGAATGLPALPVVASCSHDTGAAVAGVPAAGGDWAYLSSGTWSLMGVELPEPIVSEQARELNFTNEIGFGGSVRLLRNLSGLWLIQQCRKRWASAGREFDYGDLMTLAGEAPGFVSLIDPAAPEFVAPEDMPAQIAAFCRRTGQPVPATEGACIRAALESLALLYGRTLRQIETLTGRQIDVVHIVGGGSRNDLLNQFAANALERPVLAGPAEATAAGNILVQAIALGHLPSLAAARAVVRQSTALRAFEPEETAAWRAAAARFERLIE